MIGRTLSLYFAARFAKMVLAMFIVYFILIAMVKYFELVWEVMREDKADVWLRTLVTMLEVPAISEHAFPFATLFGSIAAFVTANRRLEIVVARAAGISAWQFLVPATVVGLLVGLLVMTVYNPLAVMAERFSKTLSATYLAKSSTLFETTSGPVWLRQAGGETESIIGANESFNSGLGLIAVTAMVFNRQGQFIERVDAGTGAYRPGEWVLSNATVTAPGKTPIQFDNYRLPTELGPDNVKQTFENINGVSFWELPGLIDIAERAGIPTDGYRLRYNALLAMPILLVSMVLVAAIVSLRFSRSKELGYMILAGIGVGFILYVVTKIARDLGNSGIVPAPIAAWSPAVVAILIGATVLLHLEDG
jgi:lipopolysaccharide export system permease protein